MKSKLHTKQKFNRQIDFIVKLPYELACLVINYFSQQALAQCTVVSQTWREKHDVGISMGNKHQMFVCFCAIELFVVTSLWGSSHMMNVITVSNMVQNIIINECFH
ncbi:hypothetical protein BDA99DRAFT_535634 [Phascolomyces articulosus]|uniref:F-box domain-containing protein n=1 Tax=Phascolomyces articulosus TaxID=60185 RepID=A0AAD5K3M7_9FUNG|nr:hypothetical protein BDA99DRAFT_535634 [Phascolomyces articulosus]